MLRAGCSFIYSLFLGRFTEILVNGHRHQVLGKMDVWSNPLCLCLCFVLFGSGFFNYYALKADWHSFRRTCCNLNHGSGFP